MVWHLKFGFNKLKFEPVTVPAKVQLDEVIISVMWLLCNLRTRKSFLRKIDGVTNQFYLSQSIPSLNFNFISCQQVGKYEWRLFSQEAVAQTCSVKKVFLEISQNSQENTCARASFLIKLVAGGCFCFSYTFKGAWFGPAVNYVQCWALCTYCSANI